MESALGKKKISQWDPFYRWLCLPARERKSLTSQKKRWGETAHLGRGWGVPVPLLRAALRPGVAGLARDTPTPATSPAPPPSVFPELSTLLSTPITGMSRMNSFSTYFPDLSEAAGVLSGLLCRFNAEEVGERSQACLPSRHRSLPPSNGGKRLTDGFF